VDEFKGPAEPIGDADFAAAARQLFCDVAAIHAVVEVEAGGKTGFLPDKRPKILFESRWFHKLTRGRFDASNPDISTPTWVRNYKGGAAEYERLAMAAALDRTAALQSASWGMFQILGVNFRLAGFDSVESYVARQIVSEGEHLLAFCNFVIASKLDDELRDRRWADFARGYNGPGYRENRYDEKLAAAYAKHNLGAIQPTTAEIQSALNRFGASLDVDGETGPATRNAIREFQSQHGLVTDGVAGPKTLAALGLAPMHDPIATSAILNG
jgi:hypothetical protein